MKISVRPSELTQKYVLVSSPDLTTSNLSGKSPFLENFRAASTTRWLMFDDERGGITRLAGKPSNSNVTKDCSPVDG